MESDADGWSFNSKNVRSMSWSTQELLVQIPANILCKLFRLAHKLGVVLGMWLAVMLFPF